jgi:hypothetical protein
MRGNWAELDPRLALRFLLANNIPTCLGDRTDMAHGIESRPPFLEHELSEYVNNLPPSVKVAFTPGKEASVSGLPWDNDRNSTASLFTEKCGQRPASAGVSGAFDDRNDTDDRNPPRGAQAVHHSGAVRAEEAAVHGPEEVAQ